MKRLLISGTLLVFGATASTAGQEPRYNLPTNFYARHPFSSSSDMKEAAPALAGSGRPPALIAKSGVTPPIACRFWRLDGL